MTELLLDTCAVLFLAAAERIRADAQEAIQKAVNEGEGVAVSPFSAWEMGVLTSKGRITLSKRPEAWFDEFVSRDGVRLAPMPPAVLIGSSFLPDSAFKDPADRVIAATAREFGYVVVTRDRGLLDYAAAGYINAIEC